MKHSLTIEFSSKEELLAYLSKGSAGAAPKIAAVTAEVANTEKAPEVEAEVATLTPAQKAQETKRRKAAEAQALATTPTQAPSTLGANPFATGSTNTPDVSRVQPQVSVAPAPIVAPVAVAPAGSPRDQWNQACIAICEELKTQPGMDGNKFGQLMVGTLTEVGCAPTDKISTMSDTQIGPFYHALKKNADGYKLSVGTLGQY